jgi:hypothetical protein
MRINVIMRIEKWKTFCNSFNYMKINISVEHLKEEVNECFLIDPTVSTKNK